MRPTKSVRTGCSNNWIPNCPRTDADAASAGPWTPWAKVTLRLKHFPNQALQARLFLWHGCPGHGCHPADGNAMQTHKVVPICNERWVYEIDAFSSAGVRKQMHLGASTRTSVPSFAGSQCNLAFSFITIPHNFMPKTLFTSKRPRSVGSQMGDADRSG